MIEVVIDFNELNVKDTDKYSDIEYKVGRYLYKKLNIGPQNLPEEDPNGRGIVWAAFSDNFTELFRPEIPEDYEYNPNDEWGWSDYQDYLNYLQEDREMGLKNEKGRRDDLRIIFVNFYPFYYKYPSIAQKLLENMVGSYAQSCIYKKYDDDDDCLKFELCIKS